jgi:hypothetical protein
MLLSFMFSMRDIRERLAAHRDQGKPLTECRRAFFLDTVFRPTRQQVLDLDYRYDMISDDWFWPKVPHGNDDLLNANRRTVADFIQKLLWAHNEGDGRRTPDQIHLVSKNISLKQAYEELLSPTASYRGQ